jgi:hypothetical protein
MIQQKMELIYLRATQCAKDCGPFRTIREGMTFFMAQAYLNVRALIFNFFLLNLHN